MSVHNHDCPALGWGTCTCEYAVLEQRPRSDLRALAAAEAPARVAALEAALRALIDSGSHAGTCGGWPSEDIPCDCGWADAWLAARALLAGEEGR